MPNALYAVDSKDNSSNEELLARIFEEEKAKLEEEQRHLDRLAKDIEGKFNLDASMRQRKEVEWYWSERLKLGSMFRYWNRWQNEDTNDPFKADTKSIEDHPGFNIVRPKMKIGKAQLEMLQFGAGTDKNFTIKAKKPVKVKTQIANQSPVFQADGISPVMGPDGQQMTVGQIAMEQSQKDDDAARKMDETVWNQLSNVDYGQKMRDGFDSMLWYGTAVYKGPFNKNKCNKVRYKTATQDGKSLWVTAYTEEAAPCFERIPVWLFYPDHRAMDIREAEHATVVHIFTPTQYRLLTKQYGFRQEVIAEQLKSTPTNSYSAFRARAIQYDNTKFLENKYIALEWHGTVGLDDLGRLGIDPPYTNPHDMYKAEIWVCQGRVIYASLELLEADLCLPFAVNVWEPDPASMFGFGSILLRDAQRVVDNSYRKVLDAAGLCALPQVAINKESIKSADGKNQITPGNVWYFTENGMNDDINKAIQFFFPPNNIEMLMRVLTTAREFGEEESTVPLITGGLGNPEVNDGGATGMTIRMQSATTVLASKAREWDDNITKPIVNWFYEWNMQYSEKDEDKGDFDVDVQTSTAYLNKIIGQRDLERLSVEASQDPDMKFLVDRTALLRARLTGMNIPYDSIVRDEEQVKLLQQQAAEQAQNNPDPATVKSQADMINAQAHQQSVQNDADKLKFEAQQGLEEARMAHQQAMENYNTRNNEAQARAMDSASKRDVALLQLAANDKQAADELNVKLNIAKDQQVADNFIEGVAAHQVHRKLDLEQQNIDVKKEEIKLKKQGKTGI